MHSCWSGNTIFKIVRATIIAEKDSHGQAHNMSRRPLSSLKIITYPVQICGGNCEMLKMEFFKFFWRKKNVDVLQIIGLRLTPSSTWKTRFSVTPPLCSYYYVSLLLLWCCVLHDSFLRVSSK